MDVSSAALAILIAAGPLLWYAFASLRKQRRLAQNVKDLGGSLAILRATLDSTADGIITIRLSGPLGSMVNCNMQFLKLWNIPPDMAERSDGPEMLVHGKAQIIDPEAFMKDFELIMQNPDQDSLKVLETKDGRFVERYVKPQRLDGETIGVIITFRDITERRRAEAEIESMHAQLVYASRQAGKAEIATNVLHNVGNVLNSVNVSSILVSDCIANSKVSGLVKTVALLQEHSHDLGNYLSDDPRGKLIPTYLAQISKQLQIDQDASLKELKSLGQNIEHIKEIVAMQQTHARTPQAEEVVNIQDLVEDALRVNLDAPAYCDLSVVREFDELPRVRLDKHKVLQILVNLVSNAKQSCAESGRPNKCLIARLSSTDGLISVAIVDNGVGIPSANLTKIFNHGFTTRKDGHGFGLHSAALTAKEMGGNLRVQSDGVDQGATFILELPMEISRKVA